MFRIFAILLFPFAAVATPLQMVTSTTDLAWAAKQIGGSHVEVRALLKGTENPHFVDAVPEFIRLTSEAQVACIVGLDLEVGWIPKVLSRSMNAQVQPGGKGYCEAGKAIQVLERPGGDVDRSMGDVHPSGNPHFWLSPSHLAQASKILYETLVGVDPQHLADYKAGLQKLTAQLDEHLRRNRQKLKPILSGDAAPVLMEYHKEFAYFLDAYGLKSYGSLEEKPGVSPSAGRLAEVSVAAKASGVRFVLAAETAPKKTLEKFSEMSGIPIVTVPMSLQPTKGLAEYGEFQDRLVDAVVKAFQTPRS